MKTKGKAAKTPSLPNETSARILAAYLALISRIGVANITLQKVADEAKVAFGTVRYHFGGDTHALTQAALSHVMKEASRFNEEFYLRERLKQKSKFNGLHAYIQSQFALMEEHPAYASLIIYYYYLNSIGAPGIPAIQAYIETARMRIMALLRESVGLGIYGKSARNEDELATSIHDLVTGALLVSQGEMDPSRNKDHRRITIRAAEALLSAGS